MSLTSYLSFRVHVYIHVHAFFNVFPLLHFQLSQLKSLQAAIEEDTKLYLLSSLESKWDRWNTSAALQATARSQRMKEKQYQDEKKKRQLDRRRVELERERVESVCVVSQHRKHLESRAEENREARAHNESMVGVFVRLYRSLVGRYSMFRMYMQPSSGMHVLSTTLTLLHYCYCFLVHI